jgi:hypothetical protein
MNSICESGTFIGTYAQFKLWLSFAEDVLLIVSLFISCISFLLLQINNVCSMRRRYKAE